jgi:hypothetical protein
LTTLRAAIWRVLTDPSFATHAVYAGNQSSPENLLTHYRPGANMKSV